MAAPRRSPGLGPSALALSAAAVAVVCCAGLPVLTGAVGGLTVAAVVGIGAGAVILGSGALLGIVLLRARHRRGCDVQERR